MEAREFELEFAKLVAEGQSLTMGGYAAQQGAVIGALTAGMEERIKNWIIKARGLAQRSGADSFSITGGVPFGLSVTISFRVGSRGTQVMAKL